MFKNLACSVSVVVLLMAASSAEAQTFSITPTQDTYVANDSDDGPDSIHSSDDGIHIRNVPSRRRVGYLMYDISELKAAGQLVANVSFSVHGHDAGDIDVYGIIEELDSVNVTTLTWNTAPGVMNDPTPALDSPVQLDLDDLVGPLLTFQAVSRTRTSTEPNQALADFINSDTDGIVVFLFAPVAEGDNAIIYTIEENPPGERAAFLEGEFAGPPQMATNPHPGNGTDDVPRDMVVSWTPPESADQHELYLGTDFNDVNDATSTVDPNHVYKGRLDPNYYPTSGSIRLELGRTYYWRIDEVTAPPDLTVNRGNIWSFTVEPFAYPIENITATASSEDNVDVGPENTVNGSGLDGSGLLHTRDPQLTMWLSGLQLPGEAYIEYQFDKVYKLHQMWIWNFNGYFLSQFGIKDATIQYSVDGSEYTTLGAYEFARATGADGYAHDDYSNSTSGNNEIDLSGVVARYIRIIANSNWSGGGANHYGLSEVRFFYIPVQARDPNPQSGVTVVNLDVTLRWRPGREAAEHDVYFSDDEQAVVNGTAPMETVIESRYDPPPLDLGETYYWRVDEVNDLERPDAWEGDLWNFTMEQFVVVDDIESYNGLLPDEPESNRIWRAWKDGIGYGSDEYPPIVCGNGTGASVGDLDTDSKTEETIVRGGSQAMPYHYDNTGTGRNICGDPITEYYSEAELTFSPAQDWSKGGAKALSLWFYGDPNNDAGPTEQLYVKLNGTKVIYDGDLSDIAEPQWRECYMDLADFGIGLTTVTSLAIGFGDEANTTPGGLGKVYFDDIRLYPARCVPSRLRPAGDLNDDCVVDHLDLEIMGGDWLLGDVPDDVWNGGFSNADIGDVGNTAGSYIFDGSTYTIEADGSDIWGTNDAFHYAYRQISGDFQMTVRVTSLEATHEFAKAGIMVRQTLDPNSHNVLVAAAPSASTWGGAGSTFQWREQAGGSSSSSRTLTGFSMPGCIGLVRRGDTFTGYLFLNGRWQQQGAATTVTMTDPVYAGLAATSHSVGQLTTATFDRTCTFSPFSGAELHQDGIIDFKDFAFLAETWLEQQLWPQW